MKSYKNVAILGSTGSIGMSALKVIQSFNGSPSGSPSSLETSRERGSPSGSPSSLETSRERGSPSGSPPSLKSLREGGDFRVVGLTAESSLDLLLEQVRKFKPRLVGIANEGGVQTFLKQLNKFDGIKDTEVCGGLESLEKVATAEGVDLVLSGVVGSVGLPALLAALKIGRSVALANKESLIMAGDLIQKITKKSGAQILPIDSEHSAMFQCIQGQGKNEIYKLILTASGGPFYNYRGDLSKVTVKQALAHPNWKMGRKITIDSATLMNKGLETIEAHFLFGVPFEKIQIVIHRQSIVHSAVEFLDGSILAQLSHPDMCLPIQYALTYPDRKPCPVQRLDLAELKRLDFEEPNFQMFPCLELALNAGRSGGTMPAALSASNETAVFAFLERRIRFTDIPKVIEKVLARHRKIKEPDLEELWDSDRWARRLAEETISKI